MRLLNIIVLATYNGVPVIRVLKNRFCKMLTKKFEKAKVALTLKAPARNSEVSLSFDF